MAGYYLPHPVFSPYAPLVLSQLSFSSLISLFYGPHSQSCFAFVLSPATLCFSSLDGPVHHSLFLPLSDAAVPLTPSHSPRETHHLKSFYPTTYFHVSLRFLVCSYISRSLVVKAAIYVCSYFTSLPLLKNSILRCCMHICTDNQNMKSTNLLLAIMHPWCTSCSTSITCCCTAGHRGSFPQWPLNAKCTFFSLFAFTHLFTLSNTSFFFCVCLCA